MKLMRDFCALDRVSITVADVLAQKSLMMINAATDLATSMTTFLVLQCKFVQLDQSKLDHLYHTLNLYAGQG